MYLDVYEDDIWVYDSLGLLAIAGTLFVPPERDRHQLRECIADVWTGSFYLVDYMKEDGRIVYDLMGHWLDRSISTVFSGDEGEAGSEAELWVFERQLRDLQVCARKAHARKRLARNLL